MVRADAIAILRILKANYPQTYRGINKEDAEDIINLWTTMFEEETAQLVTEAVKALIHTNKFPPTIADVKEKIKLMVDEPTMTELEAWTIVNSAIKNSYYNASERFNALPEDIKAVVRTPEQLRDWSQMDSETINSVVSSNFMRSYKANVQYMQQIQSLPDSAKEMIKVLKGQFDMQKSLEG